MFEKTVLILGAGASCDYGYPTGDGLIKNIIKTLEEQPIYFQYEEATISQLNRETKSHMVTCRKSKPLIELNEKYKSFHDRLKAQNPVESIDLFLKQNPEHQTVGKRLIAYEILKSEIKSKLKFGSNNDWYSILCNHLTKNCLEPSDILNDLPSIITFNYDVSLEYGLYRKLSSLSAFKHQNGHYGQDYARKICEDNTIHVYGSIRPVSHVYNNSSNLSDENIFSCYAGKIPVRNVFYEPFSDGKDAAYDATYLWALANDMSSGIEVIGEKKQRDLVDHPRITKARHLLQSAEKIIILGFGFDKSNTELLNLKNIGGCGKKIFYTNYSGQNKLKEEAEILFGSDGKGYHSSVLDAFQNHFNL